MEVAAAKATDEPREGRARQKERVAASQTVRMGERNLSSTLWKKCGFKQSDKIFGEGGNGTYDSAVASECKHHSRVRSHGEKSTMPNADHDQAHEHYGSVVSKNIDEDL